jgi:hypothetical protein
MRFTTRQLVTLAIFGALWGVVEIYLGSVLHALRIPLSGAFMAAIGLMIALSGRLFVPVRGATLFIGVVAMILKLFSIGNIIIGPILAILAEALVAELVLSLSGSPSRFQFVLAGALGVLWTLAQPFITGPLLFGRAVIAVWLDTLDLGSRLLGLPSGAAFIILGFLAILHLLAGGVAGWLAWDVGGALHARLWGVEQAATN